MVQKKIAYYRHTSVRSKYNQFGVNHCSKRLEVEIYTGTVGIKVGRFTDVRATYGH